MKFFSVGVSFVCLAGCATTEATSAPDAMSLNLADGAVEFEQGSAELVGTVPLPDADFPSLAGGRKVLSVWRVKATWFAERGPTELRLATLDQWGANFGDANRSAHAAISTARLQSTGSEPIAVSFPVLSACKEDGGCPREERLLGVADFAPYIDEDTQFDFLVLGERSETFGTVNAVYSNSEFSCEQFGELTAAQIESTLSSPESYPTCTKRSDFLGVFSGQ